MSLRKAIDRKCKDCAYHPNNGGTWRQQTAVCTAVSCSLWPVRPGPLDVDIPCDPATVSPAWLRQGHSEAIGALRSGTPKTSEFDGDSARSSADLTYPASTHRGEVTQPPGAGAEAQ
jgi:hypothetical protein